MLTDEIDALTARIEGLRALERIANEAHHFETRAIQIEELANGLNLPTRGNELLRSNGVGMAAPKPPIGLIALAKNWQQLIENDPAATLSDMDGFAQKFKLPLERYIERVTDAATKAWMEHVDRNAPPVNQEMLSILVKLKGFAESVVRIRNHLSQYQIHRTQTPASADDIRRFGEDLKALKKALSSLGSDELPKELVEFIRRAGLNGVPLDQLDVQTLEWLRGHRLLGQFVVRTA